MSKYRVLSLDGGGIRGLVTAILLERILDDVPDFLATVDLIAGTSTGGIIALGLANSLSPSELRDLYENKGKDIFDDSFLDNIVDLGKLAGADYSNRKLRRELKKVLDADTTLGDLEKKVVICTFDLDAEDEDTGERSWKPKLFHNYPGEDSDRDEIAYKVALYTSAAPTYFPSVDGYIDGGVYANNPGMAALAQALDKRGFPPPLSPPTLGDVRLLSLGTGVSLTYIPGSRLDWGYAQWAKPLITLMMDGVMGVAHFQCRQILGNHYHRLAPTFPEGTAYPLDDVEKTDELAVFAEQDVDITETVEWIQQQWT
jgi:hypothetical protein